MAVDAARVGTGALSGAGTGAMIGTAIGPEGTVIGAGVGAIAGGLAGALSGGGDNGQQAAIDNMIAQYNAVGMPPNISAPIIYQQMQVAGQMTPQLEQYLQSAQLAPSSVTDNAQTRAQLTGALQGIQANAFGGLNPQQMANQQQLMQQVNANTQAGTNAALQSAAMRGQSGGGNQLAGMLAAAQGGAQQNSNNALQIGAQGSQMQNQAMQQYLSGL